MDVGLTISISTRPTGSPLHRPSSNEDLLQYEVRLDFFPRKYTCFNQRGITRIVSLLAGVPGDRVL